MERIRPNSSWSITYPVGSRSDYLIKMVFNLIAHLVNYG